VHCFAILLRVQLSILVSYTTLFRSSIIMAKESILDQSALDFLEKYLNNASPTGYEANGQKLWMDYLKPYVDEFITDAYGTAVGRSAEHTSELQSRFDLVCRLLLETK